VDTERDFFQWFLHFIKHTKPTKEDPVILVVDGYCSHTRNLEVILAQENHVDIICLPPHSNHEMQKLDKDLMGSLKTFYCQDIEKWLRSHPERVVTVYQIGELLGNTYKRAATGEIAANGFRATGLFPCGKNIFRPHDFRLASEDIDVAPVNHPALMKTSDQPSVSVANVSPLTFAEALQSSDITPVPIRNLKTNPRSAATKKITSSPYKKLFTQVRKRKSHRLHNLKPIDLRRILFLVLKKDGTLGFGGIQLRLTLHQNWTLT
jgi:hypothetical protein